MNNLIDRQFVYRRGVHSNCRVTVCLFVYQLKAVPAQSVCLFLCLLFLCVCVCDFVCVCVCLYLYQCLSVVSVSDYV